MILISFSCVCTIHLQSYYVNVNVNFLEGLMCHLLLKTNALFHIMRKKKIEHKKCLLRPQEINNLSFAYNVVTTRRKHVYGAQRSIFYTITTSPPEMRVSFRSS